MLRRIYIIHTYIVGCIGSPLGKFIFRGAYLLKSLYMFAVSLPYLLMFP